MGAVIALAIKDLRLLSRDRMDLFFTFIFPLFVAVFFGAIFGAGGGPGAGGSKMKIAVVDEDGSPASAAFVARLEKSDEFEVQRATGPQDPAPGKPLTRAQGDDMVRRGDKIASIVLPKGFGACADNLFRGEPIRIEGTVDPSRRAESGMLTGILTKYAFQGMTEMFGDPARMRAMTRRNLDDLRRSTGLDPTMKSALEAFLPSVDRFFTDADKPLTADPATPASGPAGFEPVRIELTELTVQKEPGEALPQSSYAISFPQAVIWGILGCVTSFAISLSTERSGGTLVRLMLSPIARWQILAGKALACFVTCLLVAATVLILGRLAFGVIPRSLPMLAVSIVCIGLGFVGVMMLVATIGKTAGGSSGLGRGLLLMLAIIGGGSVPMFFMPGWMQTLSSISPFKWAILALDGAIWRPLVWAEFLVPCAVLLGFGVIGFGLGARLFAWTGRG